MMNLYLTNWGQGSFPKISRFPCHSQGVVKKPLRLSSSTSNFQSCSSIIVVQRILKGTEKGNPLNIERHPTVFEVLVLFRCLKMFCNEFEKKTMSLKFSYRSGNIIGLLFHRFSSARIKLLSRIFNQALRAHLLYYLW